MTKIEQSRIQYALKNKLADLENGNRNCGAIAIETSPDEFDRIQHGQARDLAMDALDRDSKLLREVRAALRRLDTRTFGICLDCKDEITVKRLTAVPWAASCIACQQSADGVAGERGSVGEELQVEPAKAGAIMSARILLVDDETSVRDSLYALLESAGYEVPVMVRTD
jgi:DnaK suppressor protein